MTLIVLLPATILLNVWMGALLVLLVFIFGSLIAIVSRHTEVMQAEVELIHGELTARASGVLASIPVVQSFARVYDEGRALRARLARLLGAQMPVLRYWALVSVATRASSTLAVLSIFLTGVYLHDRGERTVGEIVTFTSLATLVVGRLSRTTDFAATVLGLAPTIRGYSPCSTLTRTSRTQSVRSQYARYSFVAAPPPSGLDPSRPGTELTKRCS